MDIVGRYFARSWDARLTGTPEALRVVVPPDRDEHPVEDPVLSQRIGSVPRKIRFANGGVFECTDNDAVDRFFGVEKGFFAKLSRAEASWKIIAISAVLIVALLIGIFRYGLPAFASFAASVTPSSVVSLIDAGTLDVVDRALFSESGLDENRKGEVTGVFKELVKRSEITDPPLNLLYRDGGILGANAIALPGGTIVITDQLIGLSENLDEIAGVLAHEIGHVKHSHSLKQVYRVLGVAFMVTLVGGDAGQIVEDVISQAAALESLSYSRQFETEADNYSVGLIKASGRNPLAFVNLLEDRRENVKKQTGR